MSPCLESPEFYSHAAQVACRKEALEIGVGFPICQLFAKHDQWSTALRRLGRKMRSLSLLLAPSLQSSLVHEIWVESLVQCPKALRLVLVPRRTRVTALENPLLVFDNLPC